ncbi:CRISPR-associated endonuclease Cas2 [Spirulina major]|uniref:CRISPR-associated endonuclease Cas2 n=1 Tax=Spirulina major TaxID=270636 RepID=UPI000932487D|nr:CRISPR-associated endonuclease Cas2 [Spirulina major]
MLLYVVTYDIPSNRRRRRVAALLEGYGRRVQWSVFECVLPSPLFAELKGRLRRRVNLEEDSIRFYVVSGHTLGQVEVWGGVPVATLPGSTIV